MRFAPGDAQGLITRSGRREALCVRIPRMHRVVGRRQEQLRARSDGLLQKVAAKLSFDGARRETINPDARRRKRIRTWQK